MSSSSSSNPRKIQRVPALLLAEEEKEQNDYYPKVVSIGPHHYGKPELAVVEAFKPMAVELFIGGPEFFYTFYHEVLKVIDEVRKFYGEEKSADSKYTDKDLAEMILRDASLIIIMMELRVYEQPELADQDPKGLRRKSDAVIEHLDRFTVGLLFHDLFLVENQIPLYVIDPLLKLQYEDQKDEEIIHNFVNLFSFGTVHFQPDPERDPVHLLELTHMVLTWGARDITPRPRAHNQDRVALAKTLSHSFRRVTDLQAKGILFSPSATQSLMDVKFNPGFIRATLQLPTWIVTDYTRPLFKNLVAYELLQGGYTQPMAAYIDIMKSLMVSAEDVKELRERNILYSPGSSDEEVLNVYKNIKVYGSSDIRLFLHVRMQIQAHQNSRIKTWIAEFMQTQLRSPWTFFAFVAAAAVTILTAAQFYYAVHPSK